MRFWSLIGQTDYEEVARLQRALVDLRSRDEIEDTVLFLEHQPVVTRGRGLQRGGRSDTHGSRHMPVPPLPGYISFSESERGGDLTYHGPGQLVIYPIVKLDGSGFGPERDIHAYIRRLESVVVDELADLGHRAEGRDDATGVWVGERKVASIGIAVRKWVTYHGAAINAVNDLKAFHLISPCGFSGEVMTRLLDLVPDLEERRVRHAGATGWREWLERDLAGRIAEAAAGDHPVHSYEITPLTLDEAFTRLEVSEPAPAALTPGRGTQHESGISRQPEEGLSS